MIERPRKPSLETGFGGQWLLVVVATASLAVLGSDVLRQFGGLPALAFACYAWVLLGAVFYLVLETAVFYRFAFVPMSPDQVTGPWWINEGAAAVTVLAGTKLMAVPDLYVGQFAMVDLLAPLIVVLWAEATFLDPSAAAVRVEAPGPAPAVTVHVRSVVDSLSARHVCRGDLALAGLRSAVSPLRSHQLFLCRIAGLGHGFRRRNARRRA